MSPGTTLTIGIVLGIVGFTTAIAALFWEGRR